MTVAEFLFLAIVVYLAYRFVFNFLLPIVRATHQVRQQFRNMQGSEPGGFQGTKPPFSGTSNARANTGPGQSSGTTKGSYKPPAEDYIDFEEVK